MADAVAMKDSSLPPGVKRVLRLEGLTDQVTCLAFDPKGEVLASGSFDGTVKLWEVPNGKLLRTIEEQKDVVRSVAFDPRSGIFASGSRDGAVRLWEMPSGKLIRTLRGGGFVWSVAFDPSCEVLASGCDDGAVSLWETRSGKLIWALEEHHEGVLSLTFDSQGQVLATADEDSTVKLWAARSGSLLRTLEGHQRLVFDVAFDPSGGTVAGAGGDGTVKLWEVETGRLLRTLEGHTAAVESVTFAPNGLLASKSDDGTVRLWNCGTWETVAVIPAPSRGAWSPALAFHPSLPLLAAGILPADGCSWTDVWELDYDVLIVGQAKAVAAAQSVHHTTGKIVLVGDHSVGKSALGYRLIQGKFEKQESTHGQRFWVYPDLGKVRTDGTECEAILWDFAGQPDYRLVHALFVDNADLALVLFDAADIRDPLHGVEFWLKQLQSEHSRCPIILVAAQTDRGACSLTAEELRAFCERNGIAGPITTSALSGAGVAELIESMKSLIRWDDKAATSTTATFKRVKDYVLGLKETESDGRIIVTPEELRKRLEATDAQWRFTDAEMMTSVGHLENYGYVKRLRTSKAEQRILLQPERLNNLASSFVLEARRNPKGLGALEEKRLLSGGYDFPELRDLPQEEQEVLLDSAAVLFLEHNVCFRETDPLNKEPYLVFPELINLKKPIEEDRATEEGASYTVSGPTENVFASLVVLLGYTHTFIRTAQWFNNARYDVADGLVCGFRQEAERAGELDFVLCFGPTVGQPVRTLFQGFFESFLQRRKLTVMRYEVVRCMKGHLLGRSVVRERLREGQNFTFCNSCGERLTLPAMEGIQHEIQVVRVAERRTRFEEAIFRVQSYMTDQKKTPPECFISYAWGVPEHERWVEKRLATDLQKAGINVVLDRWHSQIGASLARFVERIEKCNAVVMVGTPLYRQKYENRLSTTGSVVAAEVDMIHNRLVGMEEEKETVLPVLLDGEKKTSLPPLLQGRVYADFRDESTYFSRAFELILGVYKIPRTDPAVADLWESVQPDARQKEKSR